MKNFLSELLYDFRIQWKAQLDSVGYVGTILMDLSKAYDYLSHNLLIVKLEAME